uniref:Uncharacterized protein n=1 Tax=Pseudo-nitzschia australis TaxID=44445 RepID=A0A7S4ENV6_9STRA
MEQQNRWSSNSNNNININSNSNDNDIDNSNTRNNGNSITEKPSSTASPERNPANNNTNNDNDVDALTITPVRNREFEKSPSDDNAYSSSPFEFPVCSDDYEGEEDAVDNNTNDCSSPKIAYHDFPTSLETTSCNTPFGDSATQNKKERKRKRRCTKGEKKQRKKEKRAEKRRKRGKKKNVKLQHHQQDVVKKSTEKRQQSDGMDDNHDDNNGETEDLETPKKFEDISPIRNPGNVLDGASIFNSNRCNSPQRAVSRSNDRVDQTSRNDGIYQTPFLEPKGGISTNKADAIAPNDPFYVSPEEIQHATENCGITYDHFAPSSSCNNVSATDQNFPVRLFCSESFLENFGEVIAAFARGTFHGNKSTEEKSIHFTDTDLMDVCGVDIETPCRGAIVISTLSQIQRSSDNGLMQTFLPRMVELVSTTRYSNLTIYLCIDVELDAATSQDIVHLQTAFLCDAGDAVQRTKTNIQLTSRACLAACISKTIFLNHSSVSSPSPFSALSKVDHWLSDQRACQRLKFLLNIIPTLSVTSSLHWLDSSRSPIRPSTQNQTEEDKSLAWFQHCFKHVDEECNRLKSLLLPSCNSRHNLQLHDCMNPYVAQQLAMVVGARLNNVNYF